MEQVQPNTLRVRDLDSHWLAISIGLGILTETSFSTDNPPPKVVQGYKVRFDQLPLFPGSLTPTGQFSSISSTRISSTNQRPRPTKLSRNLGTTKQCSCTSWLGLLMKTSLSVLSIVNGSSLINGMFWPFLFFFRFAGEIFQSLTKHVPQRIQEQLRSWVSILMVQFPPECESR